MTNKLDFYNKVLYQILPNEVIEGCYCIISNYYTLMYENIHDYTFDCIVLVDKSFDTEDSNLLLKCTIEHIKLQAAEVLLQTRKLS